MGSARYAVILLATMSLLAQGASAVASEPIGTVRSCAGTSAVARGGQVLPAYPGTRRFAGDILPARITRGTMACLSGPLGEATPGSARFEFPVGSIGIRGTRFAVKVGRAAPE